jgi:hypothetical protein
MPVKRPAPFDETFSAYERSAALRELFTATLDKALPPEVEPFSFVTLDALRAIAAGLEVSEGALLADLACGRGGP